MQIDACCRRQSKAGRSSFLSGRLAILLAMVFVHFAGASLQAAAPQANPREDAKPLRVLFIGNSYTFFNDMPRMVQALAQSAKQKRQIVFERVTPGGCTFQMHWEGKKGSKARQKIAEGNWDVVVLQEQSQMPVFAPPVTIDYGGRLAKEVNAKKARPVFFMTWARQHIPDQQVTLAATYTKVAKANNAGLAPVGIAWQAHLKKYPAVALHTRDKSHPNATGSYLAACVIYATIYEKSPVGLSSHITASRKGKTLVKLDTKRARALQEIAWATVSAKLKKKTGATR